MRIGNKPFNVANFDYVVFDRPKSDMCPEGRICIRMDAVLDYTDFDLACPMPKPPMVVRPGGKKSYDFEDTGYKAQLWQYGTSKTHWLVLKSITDIFTTAEREGFEWETVRMGEPETWANWISELKNAGFTDREASIVAMKAQEVNSLNEAKLEEARAVFLQGRLEG